MNKINWFSLEIKIPEEFRTQNDPYELKNLADDPKFKMNLKIIAIF